MPKKKKIRSFEEIINEMKEQEAMSCSPGIPHRKANFITDPDKSVNWNRQQVIQKRMSGGAGSSSRYRRPFWCI